VGINPQHPRKTVANSKVSSQIGKEVKSTGSLFWVENERNSFGVVLTDQVA